jgi:hypothetical protein
LASALSLGIWGFVIWDCRCPRVSPIPHTTHSSASLKRNRHLFVCLETDEARSRHEAAQERSHQAAESPTVALASVPYRSAEHQGHYASSATTARKATPWAIRSPRPKRGTRKISPLQISRVPVSIARRSDRESKEVCKPIRTEHLHRETEREERVRVCATPNIAVLWLVHRIVPPSLVSVDTTAVTATTLTESTTSYWPQVRRPIRLQL